VPPLVWTILAWVGVVSFPVVLAVTVVTYARNPAAAQSLRYILPVLVVVLPAGLLRRAPLPAIALMVAGSLVVTETLRSWPGEYLPDVRLPQALVMDCAVGFIAANRRPRISVVAAALALGAQFGAAVHHTPGLDFRPQIVVLFALALATAWVTGHSVRQRRVFAEALRSRAVAQAVDAERHRIARELHDMVAHSIGVIAIQAGVGSRVIDTQPAEARKAMRAIEATSRETLSGLRRALGALRRADADIESDSPLEPAPGLADIDRLTASARAAGVAVDVRWRGTPGPIPAELDLSAYRLIQEALTNVIRHADTRECRVSISHHREELTIEVVDDGRGGALACGGYGIIGMRERVGLLNGEFVAGPRPEGGFRVVARIPVPVATR
jgi:signal transduction histidine kinase